MKGGSLVKKKKRARIFKATPTRALTTPISNQGWRVLSHMSRLTAGSQPEFAQKHS